MSDLPKTHTHPGQKADHAVLVNTLVFVRRRHKPIETNSTATPTPHNADPSCQGNFPRLLVAVHTIQIQNSYAGKHRLVALTLRPQRRAKTPAASVW